MFRNRNGSIGFSFQRLADNAFPSLMRGSSTDTSCADLAPERLDRLHAHQLSSPTGKPYILDENAFYAASVCESEYMSRRVYRALHKHGILRAEDGSVDTYAIGPKFAHQIAIINVLRQRELVGMLFWWEEECVRMKKLQAEDEELAGLIAEAEKAPVQGVEEEEDEDDKRAREMRLGQLRFARERVRMKRRQRPSQRRADVEADTDDINMAYLGRSMSVPNNVAPRSMTGGEDDRPPAYFAQV